MVIASVTLHAVAHQDRFPGVIAVVLGGAANPANLTVRDGISHISAENTVGAGVLQAQIVKHRIIHGQDNILSYRKFDAVKYLPGVSCVAPQVEGSNYLLRVFPTVAGIHDRIAEGCTVIENAVRF